MPTSLHHKIAIIEDEFAIQQMYSFKLESAGFTVKTADNGVSGFKLVEEFRPGLILLDLRMPGMSGDELLQKIRQEDWGADMRVVILTNISKNEAPHVLRFLNVDRYVVKAHHTPQQITEIVKEVLGL